MQDWTYVGTADFGANPGVSLTGYTFNEVLVVATATDFPIYDTFSAQTPLLLNSASMEFYWIPELGEVQLAKSFKHKNYYDHLLITVLFNSSSVRTYKVRKVNRSTGATTNYNTAAHGHIDVYCR